MRVAIASDHAGFELKRFLLQRLAPRTDLVFVDLGTNAAAPPVDYPDYARAVAETVARGEADRGIIVCGSGAGACMAADKVKGARAIYVSDSYTAHQGVEHDAANILCLGERVIGRELAQELVEIFLRAEFTNEERHRRRLEKVMAMESEQSYPLEGLRKAGQSIWVDTIARSMLTTGELRRLVWEDHVVGLTSNPTIFEKAMSEGAEYEAPARALASQGKTAEEIYWALAIEDIQGAADVLRPVYELTQGADGYVSLECAPEVADDTAATIAMARDLWQRLDRPNAMIKIPATVAGVPAVEETIASGVNVNVTLMFSVELYEEVARAYVRGVQRFLGGHEPRRLARPDSLVPAPVSVASFFVSRVDTLVDKLVGDRIERASGDEERRKLTRLLGTAAIANARLAYERFKEIFSGADWEKTERQGARVQRPLWASTSTKNPRYRDVRYVEELIGPNTVNTMPVATLRAFGEHGTVARTIDGAAVADRARESLAALEASGIKMEAVTQQLQVEGVKLFADSFEQLLKALEGRRQALVGSAV